MTRWLSEDEQHSWRAFLRLSQRLDLHLAQQMQLDSELSISDFQVLVVLSEAPDDRLRAFELGRDLEWEKSRLSHHLTRMQKRGLVERSTCGEDRRGAFVAITSRGRAAIEAAAPAHVERVRTAVFDRLTPEQAAAWGQACALVLDGLSALPGGAE